MRIQVLNEKGLTNRKAGFSVQGPGEYDFPDDPAYAGWLQGQVARGAVRISPNIDASAPEAYGVTAGSKPAKAETKPTAPEAEGLTAGSTSGKPDVSPTSPEAEGLTIGSTPGAPPAQPDEKADQAAARVTQQGREAHEKPKGRGK